MEPFEIDKNLRLGPASIASIAAPWTSRGGNDMLAAGTPLRVPGLLQRA